MRGGAAGWLLGASDDDTDALCSVGVVGVVWAGVLALMFNTLGLTGLKALGCLREVYDPM